LLAFVVWASTGSATAVVVVVAELVEATVIGVCCRGAPSSCRKKHSQSFFPHFNHFFRLIPLPLQKSTYICSIERIRGETGNEITIYTDETSERERDYPLFTGRNTPRKYETGNPV
jgi:hypothetical protein